MDRNLSKTGTLGHTTLLFTHWKPRVSKSKPNGSTVNLETLCREMGFDTLETERRFISSQLLKMVFQ